MSRNRINPLLDRRQFIGRSLVAGTLVAVPGTAGAAALGSGACSLYVVDQGFSQSQPLVDAALAAGGTLVEPHAFVDNRWLIDASPLAMDFAQVTGLTTYSDRHLMISALHSAGFSLRQDRLVENCQRTDMRCQATNPATFGLTSQLWYWEVAR